MNIITLKKNTRNSDGERFALLAERDENVFHLDDLANLWNIRNQNTLRKTLSRYSKRNLIFRIHKGLYSIKKVNELDPYFLGFKALHRPAYLSCETVLYNAGILNQVPQEITFISSISKIFSINEKHYRVRQLQDEYLFNNIGIQMINGFYQASAERAVADMLYFNPRKYFDTSSSKMINWSEVKKIQKQVYDITK
jgi:predicted transcriptional regulator of viral defense system